MATWRTWLNVSATVRSPSQTSGRTTATTCHLADIALRLGLQAHLGSRQEEIVSDSRPMPSNASPADLMQIG